MGIILVSSVPIWVYRDDETSPIEDDVVEGQEPPVYGKPVRRYEPKAAYYYSRPVRRYEPAPIAPIRRSKKHLYLVAEEQKKEEN